MKARRFAPLYLASSCGAVLIASQAASAQAPADPPPPLGTGTDQPSTTSSAPAQLGVAAATSTDAGEIVVTAQRRRELSRDVPISITTLDAARLTAAGVTQLADIARLTPGIRFDSVTNFVQPTIRAIGTAVNVSGGGSNVGIYVDGFYSPNPVASNLELARVENVQVLKGPQGTLFGRNTTGGAILVTTADPSVETGGMAEASYGNFDAQRYRGYFTTGLNDRVAVDVEGQYRRGNGFQTNIVDGNDHIGRYENWFVRTGVKAKLTDDVSVMVRYSHAHTDDPADDLTNPYVTKSGDVLVIQPLVGSGLYSTNPDKVAITSPFGFQSTTDTVQGTVKADLGDADLTSYTQFRRDRSNQTNDFDFTAAPIFAGNLQTRSKAITQELLLTSKPGTRLQWTGGLFFYQSKEIWDFAVDTTPPPIHLLSNGTKTNTYAAYADLTYELTPNLFMTAGGRYSHDVVSDAFFTTTNPANFGTRFEIPNYKQDHFTPRVVLRYKPNQQSSVYASFSKGYKAGLLNVGGEQFTPVKPEDINAYEVGYKYEDRTFSFDVAAFYYDYKDLQVSSYFSNTAIISNAAKSRIYGLDGQARYRFPFGMEINAGAAYTNAKYRNFDGAQSYVRCDPTDACAGTFKVVPVDIHDGDMQRAPKFTGNIGARYPVDLHGGSRLTFSGNLYYTSRFFFDPTEQFPQSHYEVLALRAEWTDPSRRFTVAAFGDNVTNSRYRKQLFFNNVGIGNSWSAPATYGGSLGVKF